MILSGLAAFTGDGLRHVQVYRHWHDVEDILWHAKLRRPGGVTDCRRRVVHQGCRLLGSGSHPVHLVNALAIVCVACETELLCPRHVGGGRH